MSAMATRQSSGWHVRSPASPLEAVPADRILPAKRVGQAGVHGPIVRSTIEIPGFHFAWLVGRRWRYGLYAL